MNTTKIGFISSMDGVPWGGSEELWSRTAARLVQTGTRVVINVQEWQPPVRQVEELNRMGCKTYFRPRKTRLQRVLRRVKRDADGAWLRAERPDLVVVAQGCHIDGWNYMLDCVQNNIPFVTIAQAAYENWWPDDVGYQKVREVYQKAVACYFISENNLALTRRQLAIPLKQGKVVRNPFQVAYNSNQAWPDSSDGYKLACVGRLEPKAKGQDLIFDVLAQAKWRERPIQLTLFGKGENEKNLRELKNFYSLDNVIFGGFVPNIEEVWRTHHALVLPSRYEGLPLAVVEAMLCGRVCIVTDIAGNSEVIEDGVEGFIAAAPQPRYLDEALERAWSRRDEWQAIGYAAARKAQQCFPCDPADVFAQELLSIVPGEK